MWIEEDCGIEDVINEFNGHEDWHPDDMDHDQEWDEEYGYMEDGDYYDMDYYAQNAMGEMPSEEDVMNGAMMVAEAFNTTINATAARLCPNGSCAENITTSIIHATNAGQMINMFLNDTGA
jgi:hypothetical protein